MSHVGLVGTGVVESAAGSGAITAGVAVAAGRTITVAAAWEAGSPGSIPNIAGVTDDRGNTYSVDVAAGGSGNATVAVALAHGYVATPLQSGDKITWSLTGETRIRWALQADAFDDVDQVGALDRTAANNNPGSASDLVTGTTQPTRQDYELVVGVFGLGVGRSYTIPAGWSGGPPVETATSNPNRALQVIWRYVSTAGAQQGTVSVSPASTYAACVATYRATAPVPPGHAPPPLVRPQLRHMLIR